VQSVLAAGLEPVFCDVSEQTLDLDRTYLGNLVGPDVLAVVPVHLYGLAHDVTDLLDIGREHGIFVVEDAAQAFGARFAGRMVGTWGDAGLFSLGRGKCIPAGHGGVVVCQERCAQAIDRVMHQRVAPGRRRAIRTLARYSGYGLATRPLAWWFVSRSPLNPATILDDCATLPPIELRTMSPVHAGLGAAILGRLERIQDMRQRNALKLMAELAPLDIATVPRIPAGSVPAFLRLPVVARAPELAEQLFRLLSRAGIGVSRSYRRALPDVCGPVVHADGREYPGADQLAACLLTLPTHEYLTEADLAQTANVFRALESQTG
jgi:dTDP-4-amino-4,6-dideoxygalactose transaminase